MNPVSQDQLSRDLASLKIDRDAKPPGRGRGIFLWLAALAGAGALVYFVAVPKIRRRAPTGTRS